VPKPAVVLLRRDPLFLLEDFQDRNQIIRHHTYNKKNGKLDIGIYSAVISFYLLPKKKNMSV
jgi:hypothetical protein